MLLASGALLHGADFTPVMIKGHPAHPTRILAKVAPHPTLKTHATALAAHQLTAVRGYDLVPGLLLLEVDAPAMAMRAPTDEAAPTAEERASALRQKIDALRRSGLYEYVEPDFVVKPDRVPTDSKFGDGTLWALRNTGQAGGVAGVDIDAVRAWDVTTGSTGVIVAVIDSGIRYTHQDLAAQMWKNPGEIAGNGYDDDGNGYIDDVHGINAATGSGDPMDDDGHGTHIAGTIGAIANNSGPHVGVAWNVRLMACKFFGSSVGGTFSDLLECYDYAVAHGAGIINCSFGIPYESMAEREALAAARDRGVLVVAAAGNDASSNDHAPHYPSSHDLDNIISVAAIDRYGNRASFSNYGAESVHLGAPGAGIFSTYHQSDTSYITAQGTSMAAPHVAGVAALVRARFPGISVQDLRDRIIHATTATSSLQGITTSGGRVNAYQALTATGDGRLELAIAPRSGRTLFHGRTLPVVVRVRDLVGVTGATVTGTTSSGATLAFRDNGVWPDTAANDANYTAALTVPASGSQLSLTVNASAPGKTGGSAAASYPLQAPPPNDHFANRIALAFVTGSTTASNVGATLEAGEPRIAGQGGGASLWWSWHCLSNATVTISTEGSDFDTLLGVYTGNAINALTEVASNDDISGPNQPSRVAFPAAAGTTYHIAVDGWEGKTGNITLAITTNIPPANDNFADRIVLTGAPVSSSVSLRNCSFEPGEPPHQEYPRTGSIWWEWTAPWSGTATLTHTGWSRSAVYTGSVLTALTKVPDRVPENDGSYGRYTFAAFAGTAYQIAILETTNGPGQIADVSLTLDPAPANDHFANRTALTGFEVVATGSNIHATREIGEALSHGYAGGTTVWWTWTAPAAGTVVIDARDSSFSAELAVCTGDSLQSLQRVASSEHNRNRLAFRTDAGVAYQIAVDGQNGVTGSISLKLSLVDPPANDMFADRIALSGAQASASGTTVGATAEAGEPPPPYYADGTTVWWKWIAPFTGTAIVNATIAESGWPPSVFIYTGSGISSLTPVVGNDGGSLYPVHGYAFHAGAGEEYQIAVEGGRGDPGPFTLELSLHAAPPNDMYENRATLTGALVSIVATSAFATQEPDEPWWSGARSVWWRWTAPADEAANLAISGDEARFHSISVFTGSSLAGLTPLSYRLPAVRFPASAGTEYSIAVSAITGEGSFKLHLFTGEPPANDLFSNAAPIVGATAAVTGTNRGASTEDAEYRHGNLLSNASVWWKWVAPASGRFMVTTAGSNFNTLLDVYTGSHIGSDLARVAPHWNNTADSHTQHLWFDAVGGTTYMIAVDGYQQDLGDIVLAVGHDSAPEATLQMNTPTVPAGTPVTMTVTTTGPGPFTYQWLRNGERIPGATEATLTFPFAQGFQAGDYTVQVESVFGTATTQSMALEVLTPPSSNARLLNLSTRALGLSGENALIPGFVINGSGTRRVLLRAVGPELIPLGVSNAMPDPRMTLQRKIGETSETLATNDDWELNANAGAIAATAGLVGAFPLSPGSRDAALLLDLAPGSYTVTATDATATPGVALVELYDAATDSAASGARVVNLSNRGYVGTGADVMIPGFVVSPGGSKTVLLRAVGPKLAAYRVTGVLQDPKLTVFRTHPVTRESEQILANDNWGENGDEPAIRATAAQVGAFPLDHGSKDAAFVITLPPGIYTIHASGADDGSGVALVELYIIDP